jgi:hypothetical protein
MVAAHHGVIDLGLLVLAGDLDAARLQCRMQLRWYDDPPTPRTPSIFLAGPTARAGGTPWRREVVRLCAAFDVELVLPEFRDGVFRREAFDDGLTSTTPGMQRASERILAWETACIDAATVLLVWMPFVINDGDDSLPGFTTRAEVSRAIAQHRPRLALGMPSGALSGGHIRYHAHRAQLPISTRLEECVAAALALVPKS